MHYLSTALCLVLAASSSPLLAQQVIPVWGDETPAYAIDHDLEEYETDCWGDVRCVRQVVDPTLTLYLPQGAAGDTAIVVIPGGGYEGEAVYHEGYEIAQAFADLGITAAVLKYRLPNPQTARPPERAPAADVRRALKVMRGKQADLGFKASRVGVAGFSAGGHLAASVSVHVSATEAENPDFSILVYGVSRMSPENREWLEKTLYHRAMTEQEVAAQTLHQRVDGRTPPAFLVHAYDDDVCHYSESTLYAEALQNNGVAAEMHLYAHGGHGFGPGRDDDGTGQWIGLAADWLKRMETQQETGQ